MTLIRLFFVITCGSLKLAILSMLFLILADHTRQAATNLESHIDKGTLEKFGNYAGTAMQFAKNEIENTDWHGLKQSLEDHARALGSTAAAVRKK